MNTNTTPSVKTTFDFPEGEFTINNLIQLSGKKQPIVYLTVKKAISDGRVKELRRESRGKGRPTVIYSKV